MQMDAKSPYYRYLPWIILLSGIAFYFFVFVLRVSPSIMTHELMEAYHIDARSFGNLAASYFYIYAPMQILVGILMDRYGPRRLLTSAAVICSLGMYFFASTDQIFVAEIGRLMIGFGAAFVFVGVLKLATIWLPLNRFSIIAGSTVSLGMCGAIAGDILLTALVTHEGWRLASFLLAITGLILAIIIFIFVRDINHQHMASNVDDELPSFMQIYRGLVKIMHSKQIWINGLIGALLYMPITCFAESWQIPYLNHALGMSNHDAALAASMLFFGWVIGSPIVCWFSEKIQQRRLPITIGASVATILITYLIYIPDIEFHRALILYFICGFFCSSQVLSYSISREITEVSLAATAIALTVTIIMCSGLIVYIIGTILALVWSGDNIGTLPVYSVSNYQIAFSLIPIGLLIAVFLTFFLKETYCKSAAISTDL